MACEEQKIPAASILSAGTRAQVVAGHSIGFVEFYTVCGNVAQSRRKASVADWQLEVDPAG